MVQAEREQVVQVLYALPTEQVVVEVVYETGMTEMRAVERSGLAERYPAIREQPLVLGIWGVEVESAHPVRAGDRIEISRPLEVDPRDMRRVMMSDGRVMGGAVRKKGRG